jgi:hypothetical protein
MANKYIKQLPEVVNPNLTGYTVFDDTQTTSKLTLNNLKNAITNNLATTGSNLFHGDQTVSGSLHISISGSNFYNWLFNQNGTTSFPNYTFTSASGSAGQVLTSDGAGNVVWTNVSGSGGSGSSGSSGTSGTSGLSAKFWLENETISIDSDETIVISGDYVLNGSNLYVNSSNTEINIGNLNFTKKGKIFIGGYLLINNSNIFNDGEISVAGGVILSGDSTITGTGILI